MKAADPPYVETQYRMKLRRTGNRPLTGTSLREKGGSYVIVAQLHIWHRRGCPDVAKRSNESRTAVSWDRIEGKWNDANGGFGETGEDQP